MFNIFEHDLRTDNKLKFYDPQNSKIYDEKNNLLNLLKYKFSLNEEKNYPKLLRIDDKELNPQIINQIVKPKNKS